MKIRLIIGVMTLLLLLTGCRDLKENSNTGNATAPAAASASPVSETPNGTDVPPNTAAPTGGDSGITPSPQSGQLPEAGNSSAAPQDSASPSASSPPSAAVTDAATVAAPAASAAPKSEVNATLDDIIKELNDLDKLYSQMDNLTESDLN